MFLLLGCGLIRGVHILRKRGRRDLVASYTRALFPVWFVSIGWGLVCLTVCVHRELIEGEVRFPKKEGLKMLTGYSMGALTFLLVFQASKAQARWWEARGHLGKIILSLKHVVALALTVPPIKEEQPCRVPVLAKVLFQSIAVQLQSQKSSPKMTELVIALAHKSGQTPEHLLGLATAQIQAWEGSAAGSRVLLCWEWLRYEVVGEMRPGMHEAQVPLEGILEAYHGVAKVKMHGTDAAPLEVITTPIFWNIVTVLVPMVAAFGWFEGWSQDMTNSHLEVPQRYAAEVVMFLMSLTPIVSFTGVLRLFSRQMRDPFGGDLVDIDMGKMQTSLFDDLDLLVVNAEARRSASL